MGLVRASVVFFLYIIVCLCHARKGRVCKTVVLPHNDLTFLKNISVRLGSLIETVRANVYNDHYDTGNATSIQELDSGRTGTLQKLDSGRTGSLQEVARQERDLNDLKNTARDLKFALLRATDLPAKHFDSRAEDIHNEKTRKKNIRKRSLKDHKLSPGKELELSYNLHSLKDLDINPVKKYILTDNVHRAQDCAEHLLTGHTESGVYTIYPFKCVCSEPVQVYCDMETEGGGWTVLLQRKKLSKQVNFTRNWEDYKNGFGNAGTEYWIGNDLMHYMSHSRKYQLRFEARNEEGEFIWGEWGSFEVASEENRYKLTASAHNAKSTAYDGFSTHNGNYFSTFDRDNDRHSKLSCAKSYKGGFWYKDCYKYNPTGLMGTKGDENVQMIPWSKKNSKNGIANWLQLKIRPNICSDLVPVISLSTPKCEFMNRL